MVIFTIVVVFILGCVVGYLAEIKMNTEIFKRIATEMTPEELLDWQKKMIAKRKV